MCFLARSIFSSNFLTTEAAGEKSNHFSLRLSGPFYFFNSLISVVKSKIQQLDENYKDLYHSSCAQITAFSWSHFKIFSSQTGTRLGRGWSRQGTKHSLKKNAPWAGEKLLRDSTEKQSRIFQWNIFSPGHSWRQWATSSHLTEYWETEHRGGMRALVCWL